MNSKVSDKIYIPVLDINGETPIGNSQVMAGAIFFGVKADAERFIKKTISENSTIKDAEYKILEYVRSE